MNQQLRVRDREHVTFTRSPIRPLEPLPRLPGDPRWRWLVGAVILAVAAVGGALAYRSITATDTELEGSFVAGADPAVGPGLSVPGQIEPTVPGYISELRGLTDAVALTANEQPIPLDAGGAFSLYLLPEWTEVRVVAADALGQQTTKVIQITPTPAPAEHPATSAVHVRASDWAKPEVRQQVLDLIAAGRINAVQLDIKEESGEVGYASAVPLAQTTGAAAGHYDAAATIAELHGLGVRVIGRMVNFLDPTLAAWAAANGRSDMIVLDANGAPLSNNYGPAAFANFANPEVRQYQIDLAVEAAALGFDEILFDYVRRPEGDLAAMQFPGLDIAPDVSVARFVADARAALAGTDTLLGASVFGISATRPEAIAQDVRLLALNLDYVSPMVYPGLWVSGEYGVADPVRQPADIVAASLSDFHRIVAGTGAAIVPWLQDFNSGDVAYGPNEVRAQIDAAASVGSAGFLLWNPTSTYHVDGLPGP